MNYRVMIIIRSYFFPVCYSTLRKFSNIHTNYGRLLVIQRIRAKYGSKAAMKENRNAIHS